MNWEASGPRHFDRERIHILTSSAPDRIRSELRLSKKDAFFLLRPNLNLRNRNQLDMDRHKLSEQNNQKIANLSTRKSLFTCTYRFVVAGRGLRPRRKNEGARNTILSRSKCLGPLAPQFIAYSCGHKGFVPCVRWTSSSYMAHHEIMRKRS